MHGTSDQTAQRPRCSDCGRDTRLLADLSGVTGDAGYELWFCAACGLRERLGQRKHTAPALPRFGYGAMAKQRRTRTRRH
jgi:hypothetical protein